MVGKSTFSPSFLPEKADRLGYPDADYLVRFFPTLNTGHKAIREKLYLRRVALHGNKNLGQGPSASGTGESLGIFGKGNAVHSSCLCSRGHGCGVKSTFFFPFSLLPLPFPHNFGYTR